MKCLHALSLCSFVEKLRNNEAFVAMLSATFTKLKQVLHEKGIKLVIIEPDVVSIQSISIDDSLSLMDSYCIMADCVVCLAGVDNRYNNKVSDYMRLKCIQDGLIIFSVEVSHDNMTSIISIADAIEQLPRKRLKTVAYDIGEASSQGHFTQVPGSFAYESTTLNCSQVSLRQMQEIRNALDKHKLLVFRGQQLAPVEQIRFTACFGKPDMAWDNRNRTEEEPRIQVISNRYKGGQYHYDRSKLMSTVRYWHADTSFLANPTRYTFLYIQKVPTKYGLSYFVNTKLGYKTLPDMLKEVAHDKHVCHSYNYIFGKLLSMRNESRREEIIDVQHPLVWRTATGDALYLSELTQSRVIGLSDYESDKLLTQVTEHCKQSQFCHAHIWQAGDFLVWDNIGIMHRGGFADPEYERELHRTTVTVGDALPLSIQNNPSTT